MSKWRLNPQFDALAPQFGTLEATFSVAGEPVTQSPLSELVRTQIDGATYYVKRYRRAGKALRRWLGRSRLEGEWRNLQYFSEWGLSTPQIVAYGLERRFGLFRRGAVITLEIPGTMDLATMAGEGDPRLRDARWIRLIGAQLSRAAREMHARHFVHNDLKWRNLLVDATGQLFFIDCPSGGFWIGPPFERRVLRDLACLDKLAKQHLSRTERLRFYMQYAQSERLQARDKGRIRGILRYFEGRE